MHFRLNVDGRAHDVRLERDEDGTLTVVVDDVPFAVEAVVADHTHPRGVEVALEGARVAVARDGIGSARIDDVLSTFEIEDILSVGAAAGIGPGGAAVRPPMPGKIVAVNVQEGDVVEQGEVLMVLEAMKMQNEVVAPAAGRIEKVAVDKGSNVDSGDVLLHLGPLDGDGPTADPSGTRPELAA